MVEKKYDTQLVVGFILEKSKNPVFGYVLF